ncbi:uracil-DNA glycosylase [Halobacteriovorax sp. GB3]|uniref:uracil-DNA glycosylase n=1 Tax=Halobacteriovorax sp. GB3 TaxID=2719615 RepID=UPI00236144D8|nr:uracil-DNA glycosylase [Halobacteriovorax sp. GB3]MDD0854713.1 uracil-DNA glycosylase [Halobacteriovorax sp. GB3]
MNIESLDPSWKEILKTQIQSSYFKELQRFLDNEKKEDKVIYPPEECIFEAFAHTPFDKVKVVIIGQDPYHGEGQAHGLSFSVKHGVKTPPSLVNIYKELKNDLDIDIPTHGNLTDWAKQGVLLLNNVLTVEHSKAGSHQKRGWETFTSEIIDQLNDKKENLVFILWGSPAQKKAKSVNEDKHFIIKSPHPSPLAAYRGFFGSKPFSKANEYLKKKNIKEIDWKIRE